jgi:hypothetical protein
MVRDVTHESEMNTNLTTHPSRTAHGYLQVPPERFVGIETTTFIGQDIGWAAVNLLQDYHPALY